MPSKRVRPIPAEDLTGASTSYAPGDQSDDRSVCWELPAEASIVGKAREMSRNALIGWDYPGDIHDVVLMVDELVANAVTHGRGPIRLSLRFEECPSRQHATVVGEVADASPRIPRTRETEDLSEGGRGLWIVKHLADGFGVRPSPNGKVTWFSLSVRTGLHRH